MGFSFSSKHFLSQQKYVLDLPFEKGFLGAQPIDTLINSTVTHNGEQGKLFDDSENHQCYVSKQIYLCVPHPNITSVVIQ